MDGTTNRDERLLRIRRPCPVPWEELQPGEDETRRYCDACQLHVFNASAVTESRARRVVADSTGRTCLHIRIRPDGTVVHAESRFAVILRRGRRIAVAASAALLAACSGRPAPEIPEDASEEPTVEDDCTPARLEMLLRSLNLDRSELTPEELEELTRQAGGELHEAFRLTGYLSD